MSLTFELRFDNRLEGASNFIPWKERMTLLLEECGLSEITEKVITIPTDPNPLAKYSKKNIKDKESFLMH